MHRFYRFLTGYGMTTPKSNMLTSSLLNVILVLIESILTLILRFDSGLRRIVYPLAKQQTLVCIHTYLPHTTIYATFSYKGILLDQQKPVHKPAPDIVLNAYSFQIISALISHNNDHIDALQMRGDAQIVALFRQFLLQLGAGRIVQTLLSKIRKDDKPAKPVVPKEDKFTQLQETLTEKNNQIEALNTQNRKLAIQVAEEQSRQKSLKIVVIALFIITILLIISHFIW